MEDIIRQLGTDDFARLRIGIGAPPEGWDAADFVLSKFGDDESESIDQAIRQASEALWDWCGKGIEYCMNQYNAA
jgi:PTH1 family peptidyl-tRNA hydrolase